MITFNFYREGYSLIKVGIESYEDIFCEIDAHFGIGKSGEILHTILQNRSGVVMLLSDEYLTFVNFYLNLYTEYYDLYVDYSSSLLSEREEIDSYSVVVCYLLNNYHLISENEFSVEREYRSDGIGVEYYLRFSEGIHPELKALISFFKGFYYNPDCFSLTLKRMFFDIPHNGKPLKNIGVEEDDVFYTSEEYLRMLEISQ